MVLRAHGFAVRFLGPVFCFAKKAHGKNWCTPAGMVFRFFPKKKLYLRENLYLDNAGKMGLK
jgi:hypothetical protein